MARTELHSDMLPKVEQMPPIADPSKYDGDIVLVDNVGAKEYADELAFMQEPVVIRLEWLLADVLSQGGGVFSHLA